MDRRAVLRGLTASIGMAPLVLGAREQGGGASAEWIWTGAVTPQTAVVKAKLNQRADARLVISTSATFGEVRSLPFTGEQSPHGVVTYELTDLVPNTQYHYRVEHEGRRSGQGRFRTFPEGVLSFRVAFASCASTGSNNAVFASIVRNEPQLFVHMGDFHYRNISENDPTLFRKAYDAVLAGPRQGALFRATAIAYMWDDHDFGPDDSDRTSPSRNASRLAYDECVPHYPLTLENGGPSSIQQAFSMGRVRFIMTDNRYNRDPERQPDGPSKSMLGLAQREWFLHELETAGKSHALLVWINSVPWITKTDRHAEHGWQLWSGERTVIANRIRELGLANKVLMFSGDAHMCAIDDGTNSNYASGAAPGEKAFVVVQAAPLDRFTSNKGGPYSHGISVKNNQFGFMRLQDDGSRMEIEITCHGRLGDVIPNLRIRLIVTDQGYVVEPRSTETTQATAR